MTTFLAIVDGKIIGTRKSKSMAYTHVLIGKRDIEANRKEAYEYAGNDVDASNFRHYMEYLDGTSRFLARKDWESDEQHAERVAADVARAERNLAGARTLADFIAVRRQRYIDAVEEEVAKGGYELMALQWCLSAGNASKAASQWKYHVDKRVIPVTVK